jgi:hypothetical protein
MGFTDKLLTGGGVLVAGVVARYFYVEARETARRKSSPLQFTQALPAELFSSLAHEVGRQTKSVDRVSVEGASITIYVRSNSGLTGWTSEIDFNDYGHITGNYWLTSENQKSILPAHYADTLQEKILQRVATPLS